MCMTKASTGRVRTPFALVFTMMLAKKRTTTADVKLKGRNEHVRQSSPEQRQKDAGHQPAIRVLIIDPV